jgi:hypothetical protein
LRSIDSTGSSNGILYGKSVGRNTLSTGTDIEHGRKINAGLKGTDDLSIM